MCKLIFWRFHLHNVLKGIIYSGIKVFIRSCFYSSLCIGFAMISLFANCIILPIPVSFVSVWKNTITVYGVPSITIRRLPTSSNCFSVFVPDSPGNTGKSSDVRQFTGSMGRFTPPWFSLSRLSTEVSLCCDASWPYTGCCPMLTDRFPLISQRPSWRLPLM